MKCKICGFTIEDGQAVCPGCGTSVEELKNKGNIMYETSKEESKTDESLKENPAVVSDEVKDSIVDDKKEDSEEVEEPVEISSTEVPEEEPVEISSTEVPEEEPVEVSSTEVPEQEPVEKILPEAKPVETPVTEAVPAINEPEVPVFIPEELDDTKQKQDDDSNMEPLLDEEKDSKGKKKSKVAIIILVIILAIVLICGAIFAYFNFVYGSASNVLSRVANKALTEFNDKISPQYMDLSGTVKLTYSNPTDSTYNFLNGVQVNFDTKSDTVTGTSLTDLGLTYDNSTIKANMYTEKGNMYILLNDIYSKYIIFSDDNTTSSTNSVTDSINVISTHKTEVKTLVNEIEKALVNSVDTTKITKSYDTISVNNSNKLAAKFEYNIKGDEVSKLITKVYTYIKNDEAAVNALATLSNISNQEVKEQIDTKLANLNVTNDNIDVVIYTDLTTSKVYKINYTVNTDNNSSIATLTVDGNYYVLDTTMSKDNMHLLIDTKNKTVNITTLVNGGTYGFNINYNLTTLSSITYPDVTDAVNYNKLTTDDTDEIEHNLANNSFFTKIVTLFSNKTNTQSSIEED